MLELNGDGREAIGVNVEPHKISGVLTNLAGHIKSRYQDLVLPTESQEELLTKIKSVGDTLTGRSERRKLNGIGLASHGIVDKNGIVVKAARLTCWEGVNIPQFMAAAFDIPFAISDSTRAKAIAEYWFGAANGIEEFLLLDLGFGIGASLVTGGVPVDGATNSAGEIGHSVVVRDGRLCRCGMTGCLETVASLPAIEEEFCSRHHEFANIDYAAIVQLARQGHDGAEAVLKEAGEYIGMVASTIINFLNPGHTVICGEIILAGEMIMSAIDESLRAHTLPIAYNAMKVVIGSLGQDASALGAASCILSSVFEQ
jgi:predicted NBD/HSP70 family sugar kinase